MFQYTDADYLPGTIIYHHPEFQYRRSPGISSTQVKTFANQSAAHFQDRYLGEPVIRAESSAMVLGSLVHCLVLEPEQVNRRYQVVQEPGDDVLCTVPQMKAWLKARNLTQTGTKSALVERILEHDPDAPVWIVMQQKQKQSPRKLIKPEVMFQAQCMADSVMNHPKARNLLTQGEAEVSVWGEHEETGQMIKCRPDWLRSSAGVCVDLKTCQCAAPHRFSRGLIDFGYDLQQAHYLSTLKSAGYAVDVFAFIAVESESPSLTQVYLLDTKGADAAMVRWHDVMNRLAQCQQNDCWPGYTNETELRLPAWYYQQYGVAI